LLDNFDGDALGMWRTAGRVRSAEPVNRNETVGSRD
jgi:hypothetical protein